MSEFIFENEERVTYHLCTPDQWVAISKAKCEGNKFLQTLVGSEWSPSSGDQVGMHRIYRVLAKPYLKADAYEELSNKCVHVDGGEYSGYYIKQAEVKAIIKKLTTNKISEITGLDEECVKGKVG